MRGVARRRQRFGQRLADSDADPRCAGFGTTAVMIGALTLYNITPGPTLFRTSR